ncbi:MAG: M64 family metallopeptidase [Pseudomonadota bacterium]
MGTSDGTIGALVKVHDGGNPADRLNLVVVSDGYTAGRMSQFQQDVDDFVANLFSQPPFDEEAVACGFNIYRLEVTSNEGGADKPDCDGAGPTPEVMVDTYFDSTFCASGGINRCLYGDAALVQQTVENVLPEWGQILVFVDDPQRGGCGGSVGWTSNSGADWLNVAVHELGHSIYNLADEYNYGGDDTYTGSAMAVNIDTEPDPALVKWNALVTAGADIPTQAHGDCSVSAQDPSPVPVGTVGTFEGAAYSRCGVYRPEYNCMMRDTGAPFCAVCRDEIRDIMSDYAAPSVTGDVTLDTPSITFDDIPEDTSTVRPIVFNVDTCLPVTFEVTAPPAAPFSVDGSPFVVSDTSNGTVRLARIWIRYDCAAAGISDASSITIRLAETGEEWPINLSGNCVPRETAAVQLVFDRSGSMLNLTSEGRIKADVLKDSARVLADVAYEDTGLGANTYDEDAQNLLDTIVAGPLTGGAGRDALRTAINVNYAPNPSGLTATGDGIEFAKDKLDANGGGYTNRAMIVLTDGQDTASKTVAEVADGVIDQTVYAIGLGTAEQINPVTLEALAGATGGYTLMTGLLTEDDRFTLEKFYLQILAGITNNDIILDPEGHLTEAAPVARIPFDVVETDIEITSVILSLFPSMIDVALEAPNGETFALGQAATNPLLEYSQSQDSVVMRSSLPLVGNGGEPLREGRWHLVLKIDIKEYIRFLQTIPDKLPDIVVGDHVVSAENNSQIRYLLGVIERLRNHGVHYSAIVQTYSNLNMKVSLDQTGHEPGADMMCEAILTEYGGPFRGGANVAADVTRPNGSVVKVNFAHQGDGIFTGQLTASQAGLYTWRVRAAGDTQRGRPFTREQTRTASVWAGGDRPGDGPGGGTPGGGTPGGGQGSSDDGNVIDLLCCLLEKDGLSGNFDEWLKSIGINPETFRRCLAEICKEKSDRPKSASSTFSALNLSANQSAALVNRLDGVLSSAGLDEVQRVGLKASIDPVLMNQ